MMIYKQIKLGPILSQIVDTNNIIRAYNTYISHVKVKKRKRLIKKYPLTKQLIKEIQVGLIKGKYRFKNLIDKPINRTIQGYEKPRELQIPKFKSRVTQFAIYNIIEPIINKKIHTMSFASRKGYGLTKMTTSILKFIKKNPKHSKYCFEMDIKKFYNSIDHTKLKEILKYAIPNPKQNEDLLNRLNLLIDSVDVGLPIGYPGSQLFANYFLSNLYHTLHRNVKNIKIFIYMDNVFIFAKDKSKLHRAHVVAKKWCKQYKLKIKGNWRIFPIDKQHYINACGLQIKSNNIKVSRGIFRRLNKTIKNFVRFRNKKYYTRLASQFSWMKQARKDLVVIKKIQSLKETLKRYDLNLYTVLENKQNKYNKRKPFYLKNLLKFFTLRIRK